MSLFCRLNIMMENIIEIIEIFLLSAVPIIEQKGSIALGLYYELDIPLIYFITWIGAILPSPFILLFIPKVFEILKKFKYLGKLVSWYENRAMKKGSNIVKYEMLGLLLFVAFPIPGTGVWTGSAVASLIGLDFKKSLVTVTIGAAICGIILTLAYNGAITFVPGIK